MAIIKIEDLPIKWAKLTYEDRDMGPEDGSETGDKITAKQGQYTVQLMLTDEKKQEMIDAGIPTKGMIGQNFKTDNDGQQYYNAKRGHFNPYFTDEKTGEKGVVVGPPKVFTMVDGEAVDWDWDNDGKLGNGTVVTAKFNLYKPKNIVEIVALLVTEHVPYEVSSNDGSW